ncbi:hypothetical protein [Rhizobium sp. NZLR11]|uniref:hypothetical protein n=1 Tax=Rhizobium sp. NZLR11 TaxID=2731098 RepID=UPI001C833B0C|nr:hypothetical protein [Rhizobium sp. NZLR11]MBX5206723.1 hypothetical protein [Rhizobium sp. NZLR11]
MLRRDFLAGVSSTSLLARPQRPAHSVKEAIAILEGAVRREISDIEEVRVRFEAQGQIPFLFAVVRKKLT